MDSKDIDKICIPEIKLKHAKEYANSNGVWFSKEETETDSDDDDWIIVPFTIDKDKGVSSISNDSHSCNK